MNEPVRLRRRQFTSVPIPRSKPLADHSVTTATIGKVPVSSASTRALPPGKKAPKGRISCGKAQEIVADFGFSDIEAKNCKGSSYDFAAKRDGKPFSIRLSAASGELTEVKRN